MFFLLPFLGGLAATPLAAGAAAAPALAATGALAGTTGAAGAAGLASLAPAAAAAAPAAGALGAAGAAGALGSMGAGAAGAAAALGAAAPAATGALASAAPGGLSTLMPALPAAAAAPASGASLAPAIAPAANAAAPLAAPIASPAAAAPVSPGGLGALRPALPPGAMPPPAGIGGPPTPVSSLGSTFRPGAIAPSSLGSTAPPAPLASVRPPAPLSPVGGTPSPIASSTARPPIAPSVTPRTANPVPPTRVNPVAAPAPLNPVGAPIGQVGTTPAKGGMFGTGINTQDMILPLLAMQMMGGGGGSSSSGSDEEKKEESDVRYDQGDVNTPPDDYDPGSDPEFDFFDDSYYHSSTGVGLAEGGMVSAAGAPASPMGGAGVPKGDPLIQAKDQVLVMETIKAVQGQTKEPEKIIAKFVKVFGKEALADLMAKLGIGKDGGLPKVAQQGMPKPDMGGLASIPTDMSAVGMAYGGTVQGGMGMPGANPNMTLPATRPSPSMGLPAALPGRGMPQPMGQPMARPGMPMNQGRPMPAVPQGPMPRPIGQPMPISMPMTMNPAMNGMSAQPMPRPMVRPMAYGGLVKGYAGGGMMMGDGLSDSVPAMANGNTPINLSNGEFVVPSDVVSGIGNGSTEAGAGQLYDMLNRVRTARTGVPAPANSISPQQVMPR